MKFYKTKKTEHNLQKEIVTYVKNLAKEFPQLETIFSVPNGIYFVGASAIQSAIQMNKLKSEGLKNGAPDLCIPLKSKNKKFNCLFIECKTETGKLSDNQKEFIEILEKNGSKVSVIRTLKDFVQLLTDYLGISI